VTQKYYTVQCNPSGTDQLQVEVVVTSVNDYKGSVNMTYSVNTAGDSVTPTSGQISPPANGQASQTVNINCYSTGGTFSADGNDGSLQDGCTSSYT